jgi:hypothetical protein
MYSYFVFGRSLYSELHFPELENLDDSVAGWRLTVGAPAEPPVDADVLGEDEVQTGVRVQLSASSDAYWLRYDDTGCFRVSRDGRSIVWCTSDRTREREAREDILGRVLAVALHAEGKLCLHGSAVQLGETAVGFLAPKFHGKSTTAMALVASGGRLLTDDTLVVDPLATPVVAHPGVHAVRLWADSAAQLTDRDERETRRKHCVTDLPADRRANAPVPLSALYLLAPRPTSGESDAVKRIPIDPMQATLALVGHGKLATLIRGQHAAECIRRAAEVARGVPVYRLEVTRDFSRLPEVVEQLRAWHGVSALAAAAS